MLCVAFFGIGHQAHAAVFYVDFECNVTATCGNGTATTTSFYSLDQFTESARSAGDIVFVRRNTASTTAATDLTFTSDGTTVAPLTISADNDNLWNDASTTPQTYTVAIATSTFVASATITNMSAGDWIYVTGDCTQTYKSTVLNQCEYFYEVASVSGTILELYLPYKGDQSGAGLSLVNMGKNPQWHTAAQDFQWDFDTDDYWIVKGLDIRGTDANGNIEIDTSYSQQFSMIILTGNGANDVGIQFFGPEFTVTSIDNLRVSGVGGHSLGSLLFTAPRLYLKIRDSIFQDPSDPVIDSSNNAAYSAIVEISDVYSKSSLFLSDNDSLEESIVRVTVRNLKRNGGVFTMGGQDGNFWELFVEDDDAKGKNANFSSHFQNSAASLNNPLTQSTSTLRSGGGPTAIEVRPTTKTTSIWDFNKIKLFEYPIYTDTSSKQYDVYFRTATTTAEWTANPTAAELWIQCEYWAHDTNATSTRKVKKSTGTVDFAGSAAWQNLTVTCQPTQTGILYLSGYYAKTKESGQDNVFLVDSTPVIQ